MVKNIGEIYPIKFLGWISLEMIILIEQMIVK
jgi:hypothetical protein